MTLPEALSQAQALLRTGQRDQAAALCRGILRQMPEQADTLHLLGLMAQEDGEGEAALDYLRRACAAPGARAVYFSNFAETCRRAALLSEAEQAARRAVALDAQNAGAWNNLGIILQEGGQYAESKACLERSLALMPDNPQAHNNFANTCKRLGLLALAERHWLRALELRDDYPEPHSNLAHLCYDIGAYDRGAYHARRAIAIAPGFVDAYINLGILETARGNDAASLSVLDRAVAFAPHNPQVLAAKSLTLNSCATS
jgi:tetratricopeptide (TPR) repeat protein